MILENPKTLIDMFLNNPDFAFVDVHGHLFSWYEIPDSYIKTRAPFREKFLRRKRIRWMAGILSFLWPLKDYRYITYLFKMLEKRIVQQSFSLRDEMFGANVGLMVLNMMDLGMSSFGDKPEIPWKNQINHMKEVARYHYGVLMPFVHIDPRRPESVELAIEALEKKGFLGVKMYPALGWNPWPNAPINDLTVKDNLTTFYNYAVEKQIPINAHCSRGGAYSDQTMDDEAKRLSCTDPNNWARLAQRYPDIRLNLCHSGQDIQHLVNPIIGEDNWAYIGMDLCRTYKNIYMDLAYNDQAHDPDERLAYFQGLNKELAFQSEEHKYNLKKKIMVASDWPMMRHTWTLKQWFEPFLENLPAGMMIDLVRYNALRFLFADLNFPARIRRAFQKRAADTPAPLRDSLKKLKSEQKKEKKNEHESDATRTGPDGPGANAGRADSTDRSNQGQS